MKIDDYFAPSGNRHPSHHKHIDPKDRLAPADQPSLSQVFAEIEVLLTQQAE